MWHETVEWFSWWWDRLLNFYQVNPFIFVSMYSVKSVIYWWTMVLIILAARKRQWDRLPGLILFNVAVNVSPWAYVWLFGTNLPWWYPYMMWWLMGWALIYLVWHVRKKLHQFPGAG